MARNFSPSGHGAFSSGVARRCGTEAKSRDIGSAERAATSMILHEARIPSSTP